MEDSNSKCQQGDAYMLREVYRYSVTHREKIISVLHYNNFEDILQKAKTNWIPYVPQKTKKILYGIDSSYNVEKYQGLELSAVDAVSIRTTGDCASRLYQIQLERNKEDLREISSRMEITACQDTVDLADFVLMDGSLYSHFVTKHTPLNEIKKIITKRNNVIFISKTSNSNMQYGSVAGDIFYYNHGTVYPGFSIPYVNALHGKSYSITTSYVRLAEDTPIMKVELLGDDFTNSDMMKIMNVLSNESVGGYPYCLKMAHNECKISRKDLKKVTHLFGTNNERGSRDLLEWC